MILYIIYLLIVLFCAVRTFAFSMFTLRNSNKTGAVFLFILTGIVLSCGILGIVRL